MQDPAPRPVEAPTTMFTGIRGHDSDDSDDDGANKASGPGRMVHSVEQLQQLAAQGFGDDEDNNDDSDDEAEDGANQSASATAKQQPPPKKGFSAWLFGGRKR